MSKEIDKLKKAVGELVEAEVAYSWKGSGPARYIPAIEADLRAARAEYKLALVELERKVKA